jgi:hypothetical protein
MRAAMILAVLLLAPVVARAEPVWGVGAERDDAIATVVVTRALGGGVGVQMLAGAGWTRDRETSPVDVRASATTLRVGVRPRWWALGADGPVRLGLVAELAGIARIGRGDGARPDAYGVTVELGVRPEWFVAPWLSVHSQLGVRYAWTDASDAIHDELEVTADLAGRAGLTLWF